ncbi:MAG: hypothetical protein KAJ91_02910 [Candidatus Aenigmarchaeota archaeon]|nr:hypothetical protein [Candidatus Aenigmarchaeota archaeon]
MLVWIIFLVLSAVVLTILGVGMLDAYGKARIEKKKMIKEGAVAGRYKDGVISIADVIRLPSKRYHVLTDFEKTVVKDHERFHEIADELGYLDEAKKEHYADLTAIRAAYDNHGKQAALGAVGFVKKMGRAKDSEAIDAIENLLENGYEGLTPREKKMIDSGDKKISNFYSVANNFYSRFGDRENDGSERSDYDMRLGDAIGGVGGFGKGIYNYLKGMVDYAMTSSDSLKKIVKGAYTPGKGYAELPGTVGEVGSGFLDEFVYKPLKLKKS